MSEKKGWSAFPWILLVCLGVYTVFFTIPKPNLSSGLADPAPLFMKPAASVIEEKHDSYVFEPLSGIKVLAFWMDGKWEYVGVPGAGGLDLKSLGKAVLGVE